MRVGKAATYKEVEVTQACYLAILDGDRASSSEDADDDNDDDGILDRSIESTSGNVDAWSLVPT